MPIYFGSILSTALYLGSTAITEVYVGSTASVITGFPLEGFTPTGAYSVVRPLFSTFDGSLYTLTTGKVSSLTDQTGNERHLTQSTDGLRPVIAESFGIDSLDFTTAGGEYLVGPNLSEFITATDGYMVVSFACRTVERDGTAQLGNRIISDAAEGGNILAGEVDGVAGVYSLQYDGSYDATTKIDIIKGSPYVVSFRKTATKLYCRLNLGEEVEVDNGSLTALEYALHMSAPSDFNHDGPIYEFVAFDTVPSVEDRDVIVSAFMGAIDTPTTAPDLSGYPGASSTGTTGDLTPSIGDMEISTNNTLVENLDITGSVTISGTGVTLRNCKITSGGFGTVVVTGDNATISHCEIDSDAGDGTRGISVDASGVVIEYNNIYNCEDGIYITAADDLTIQYNYIHDLDSSNVDPHYDGIASDGGATNILVQHNTVLNNFTQTSSVIFADTFSGSSGITINNNYLDGGAYTVYIDAQFGGGDITDVTITNNYVSKGANGFFNFNSTTPTTSGNREAETGTLLA